MFLLKFKSGKERSVIQRKSTSLGALGQQLHGEQLGLEPREDCRANAVQICPICRFQAATKNPYRNLQVSFALFLQDAESTSKSTAGSPCKSSFHGEDQVWSTGQETVSLRL